MREKRQEGEATQVAQPGTLLKNINTDPTIFGDMDDKKAFLVAQGDALVI